MKILLTIFAVAVFLRFFQLGSFPPAVNWDEISHGYNALSILKTGQDEWGQWYPIANFRAYGDYPLPFYMYLLMPLVAVFGLSELIIRIPSALSGSLLVVVAYLLGRDIFKSQKIGLIAAGLLAVSPWSLMTSRQVLQATPAGLLVAFAVWLWIRGKYIWATVVLGLSAYTYHNTRIIAPLLFVWLLLLSRQQLWKIKKQLIIVVVIAGIFFVPLVPIVFSSAGSARSNWVGILDQGAINRIEEQRGLSTYPQLVTKLLYNRVSYFASVSTTNYLSYFSPWFLAIDGGSQYQFSVPHFGEMYPIELPFFYIGLLLFILKNFRLSVEQKVLVGWLLLAPLPAAVTRDPYQVVRALTMLPIIQLITAYGFVEFIKLIKSQKAGKLLVGLVLIVWLVLVGRYLYNWWVIYPVQYSWSWQYGYKQAIHYVVENQDKYQTVAITKKYGEPHEYLLFFTQYDPASYRNDPQLVRYEKSNWFWVDGFSKYKFLNDWEVIEKTQNQKKMLLVTSPGNYPQNAKLLQTIYFLDGKPVFDIVEL